MARSGDRPEPLVGRYRLDAQLKRAGRFLFGWLAGARPRGQAQGLPLLECEVIGLFDGVDVVRPGELVSDALGSVLA